MCRSVAHPCCILDTLGMFLLPLSQSKSCSLQIFLMHPLADEIRIHQGLGPSIVMGGPLLQVDQEVLWQKQVPARSKPCRSCMHLAW